MSSQNENGGGVSPPLIKKNIEHSFGNGFLKLLPYWSVWMVQR
jgi:hypothetical protein